MRSIPRYPEDGVPSLLSAVTREPQYAACFREPPIELGAMTGSSFRWNPRRLGFMLARYKFVAQMLKGQHTVAEIGCSDGFAGAVVREGVQHLHRYDFDQVWVDEFERLHPGERAFPWDIVRGPLHHCGAGPGIGYNAIYMLDVLEHIVPADEPAAMRHICASLHRDGIFIAGCPSLESQAYASELSKAGHVNCKTGDQFVADARLYFDNVFLFGMNDEVLHTGFAAMCHYLFVLCCGPRRT